MNEQCETFRLLGYYVPKYCLFYLHSIIFSIKKFNWIHKIKIEIEHKTVNK